MFSRDTISDFTGSVAASPEVGLARRRHAKLFSDTALYNKPAELLAAICRLECQSAATDVARLGDQLLIKSNASNELLCFKLLLPAEVILRHYHLSVLSPLGRAVYQRRIGDDIVICLGRKPISFRLLHIHR